MLLKNDILSKIYKKTGYKKSDIKSVLDAYHEVIYESLLYEDGYRYGWLGLKVNTRKPKPYINVVTKKPTIAPTRKKVVLNISKNIQSSIKEEWEKEGYN